MAASVPKMPMKIKEVHKQILAHPEYKIKLDDSTRWAFEAGCVGGGSWCDNQNNVWSRKLWRQLHGVPEPPKKRKDSEGDEPGAKRKMPHFIDVVQHEIESHPEYTTKLDASTRAYYEEEVRTGRMTDKHRASATRYVWKKLYAPPEPTAAAADAAK